MVNNARFMWLSAIADALGPGEVVSAIRYAGIDEPFPPWMTVIRVYAVSLLEGGAHLGEAEFIRSSITGNVNRIDVRVAMLRNPQGDATTAIDIEQTIVHEIGHAFGISGFDGSCALGICSHSPNPADIMYSSAGSGCTTLSVGDALTIGDLYTQLEPTIIRNDF